MKKICKILYIITLPDLGGAQVHLYGLISNLPKNITPYVIIGKKGWLSEQLELLTPNVYFVPTLVRQISFKNDIKAILDIRELIQEIKPDIIHCHSSKAGFLGRISAKMCGVPVVFTAHGWAFTEGVSAKKRFIYKNIEKMMAKFTKKIICVSNYDRQLALDLMPEYIEKLVIIHNGIPDRQYEKLEQQLVFNLVMIARFSSPKDQIFLIYAIEELLKERLNIQLNLVGDGPNFSLAKEIVEKLQINQCVKFLGARTDIEDILSKNDIFLLISNWEGFPISIIEAMRQGLPVVASNVGGVSESVIDGKTGFLIPRGNKEALKEKIKELYEKRNLCYEFGQNGRKRYLENFTSDKMVEKIIKIYEEILNRKII